MTLTPRAGDRCSTRVRSLRGIFLLFMTWLLAVFLPGHTRGAITLGERDRGGDACCAPAAKPVSCCDEGATEKQPSTRDRQNCAVCFFAAGLLTTPAFVFDNDHVERAYLDAHRYDAQVRAVALRLTRFGRDPPIDAASRVV